MRLKQRIKDWIDRDALPLRLALGVYNHLPLNNRIRLRGNALDLGSAQLRGCRIDIAGRGNTVTIDSGARLMGASIHIRGNDNHVHIGKYVFGAELDICVEDDGGNVTIGEHTSFAGHTHLACIEGSAITIGRDCMFSANITLRTGDSHSVLDEQGRRINPSKAIAVGDHVWVGNTVFLGKGVRLGDHSIVGTGSIVTRKFEEDHVVIAGNPGRIVKTGVSWCRERIACEEESWTTKN